MNKILFISDSISFGGASKMLLWLAKQLSADNNVDICYINGLSNATIPPNVNSFRLSDSNLSNNALARNTINVIIQTSKFVKLLKKERYALVINFGDHAVYPLVLAKLFVDYKLLISERIDPYSSRRMSEKIRRALYRYSNYMVFQTQKALEFYPKKVQKQATVIYNPVVGSVEEKWNIDAAEDAIVSVARIDIFQKRQDVLLHAFKKVSETYPTLKLKIAGTGPDDEKLIFLVKQLELENKVDLLGYRKDIRELLLHSKLFVLSSDFEGIPNSVIEALQMEMPVVCTDCSPGGAALLLDNGKHGLLVEKGNAQKLAEAIVIALKSKNNLQALSQRTHHALDRFCEEDIALQWKQFITKCIN